MWRSSPSWQAVSANRHPSAGHFMSNQQSLGLQLAQLSRDASAAVSFYCKRTDCHFFFLCNFFQRELCHAVSCFC